MKASLPRVSTSLHLPGAGAGLGIVCTLTITNSSKTVKYENLAILSVIGGLDLRGSGGSDILCVQIAN